MRFFFALRISYSIFKIIRLMRKNPYLLIRTQLLSRTSIRNPEHSPLSVTVWPAISPEVTVFPGNVQITDDKLLSVLSATLRAPFSPLSIDEITPVICNKTDECTPGLKSNRHMIKQ